MNNLKKFKIIFLLIVINAILSTSFVKSIDLKFCKEERSSGVVLNTQPIRFNTNINFKSSRLSITDIFKTEENLSNIPISNKTAQERYPRIVTDDEDVLVAYELKNNSKIDVFLIRSKDFGMSWSDEYRVVLSGVYGNYSLSSPSLCIKPGSKNVYVGIVSAYNNSGTFAYFNIPDISSDIIPADISIVDWSTYGFYKFSDLNIIHFANSTTPWVTALIGSTNYTNETGYGACNNSVMFSFNSLDNPSYVSIAWFPSIENCSNLSIANEYGNEMIYGVCEINNNSNKNLLFFKGNPALWSPEDADLINYTIAIGENLLHPKIAVKGGNIYIVAESNESGIVMFHSNNTGNAWSRINVTNSILPPTSKPSFPNILIDDSNLICTFIESGNLSLTISNNNGINWSEPIKINDVNESVVEGYNYYELANRNQIVWTDIRSGNQDIYYYLGSIPEIDLAVLDFNLIRENPIIPINNLIRITVKNSGIGSARNVPVVVSYECEGRNATTIKYNATILYLGKNQTETITTNLFLLNFKEIMNSFIDFAGIKNITVTVDPFMEKNDANYSNNVLKKNIEYKDIFTIFWRLENLFKTFKK